MYIPVVLSVCMYVEGAWFLWLNKYVALPEDTLIVITDGEVLLAHSG